MNSFFLIAQYFPHSVISLQSQIAFNSIPFYPLENQSFAYSHFNGEYELKVEKQIQNLTEITITPTATHFRPTVQVRPLQPRIISMNKRLERQKFLEEHAQNSSFRGHPNYDRGLQYRILPEENV